MIEEKLKVEKENICCKNKIRGFEENSEKNKEKIENIRFKNEGKTPGKIELKFDKFAFANNCFHLFDDIGANSQHII